MCRPPLSCCHFSWVANALKRWRSQERLFPGVFPTTRINRSSSCADMRRRTFAKYSSHATTVCADGTHFGGPQWVCFAPPKEKQSLDSLPTPLRGPFEKLSHRTCRGGPPMPATTFKEALPPVRMRRVMRGTGHPHYAGERADRTFHQKFHQIFFVLVRQYT